MLKAIVLAAMVVVPVKEVKQPPEAPPGYIVAGDNGSASRLTTLHINIPKDIRPWMGEGSPPAPQAIVLVVCRVDDLTGQPGRHPPELAAKGWRDLELHVENGELQCKREEIPLEDAAMYSPLANGGEKPLAANFGNPGQCARAGVMFATINYKATPGWDVVAVGCPTPITDGTGRIIAWKLPECPRQIAALKGIRCNFTESMI